jgi:alpha-beta hydrolase superfamily lysophospholipase
MLHSEESSFTGAGGVQLFSQAWRARAENGSASSAAIALVHGIGEHSGRYVWLVEHLTASGFSVYSFDHRGHGRSPGRRGHITSWSEYRDDVAAFLERVRRLSPGVPIFIYGHSLGALIVAEFVESKQPDVAGVILSGIPLQPTGVAKPYMVALARIFSRILPSLLVSLGVNPYALSRDKAVAKAYEEDPLVHHRASMRWGAETLDAIDRVRAHASDIRLPLLILHGEADQVNAVGGSRELLEKVSSSDKELRVYPGGAHEPHNDLDRDKVLRDVVEWLTERVSALGAGQGAR